MRIHKNCICTHQISQDVLGEACPSAQPDGEDTTFCSFASMSRDYELSLHVLKATSPPVEEVPSESGTPPDGAATNTPNSAAAAAAAASHEASLAAAAASETRGTAVQSILSRKPRVPISAAGGCRKKVGCVQGHPCLWFFTGPHVGWFAAHIAHFFLGRNARFHSLPAACLFPCVSNRWVTLVWLVREAKAWKGHVDERLAI